MRTVPRRGVPPTTLKLSTDAEYRSAKRSARAGVLAL
jgi:hypothetical protein